MTARTDGKHYTFEELERSHIFKVMEYEYRYLEEVRDKERKEKKGIKGEISSDEVFDMW